MSDKKKKRHGMNDILNATTWGIAQYIWKGHVVNWFWRDSTRRRIVRESVHMQVLTRNLTKKWVPYIQRMSVPVAKDQLAEGRGLETEEKIFVLWFQGEENAPKVVKACIESIRERYKDRVVLLTSDNLDQYVKLPDYIVELWKNGEMISAHYSDIVRMELLKNYGGYWIDATALMTGEIFPEIEDSDFFMFMAGERICPYMFVQNCFIRSKRNNPLLVMWENLVLEYWKSGDRPDYYFLVQYLFQLLVTHNEGAARLFEKMPRKSMDPTHVLWHEIGDLPFEEGKFKEMTQDAFFQKCSYKPHRHGVNEIKPGSFADVLINGKK